MKTPHASPAPAIADPEEFSRTMPAVVFGVALAAYVLHHFYIVWAGEAFQAVLFGVPMFAGWGLGGIIHPPAFYSLTVFGQHLPAGNKVMGAMFGLAGAVLGFMWAVNAYERVW
jgi:hypothetical protein